MANQRAPGQTMVGFWADEDFTAKINTARNKVPRSQWLRDVIADHLRQKGFVISDEEKCAPDRTGKGGPRKANTKSTHDQVRVFEAAKKEASNSDERLVDIRGIAAAGAKKHLVAAHLKRGKVVGSNGKKSASNQPDPSVPSLEPSPATHHP